MHEEEHDQGGLAGSDGQRHNDVEAAEVYERSPHRDPRQRHQREDDGQVRPRRNNMMTAVIFRHARHSLLVPVNQI